MSAIDWKKPRWGGNWNWDLSRLSPSRLPRLAGYLALAFVLWLLFWTLFAPFFSTSASRAVLNAPAVLLTTPIDGVVRSVNVVPGASFARGDVLATVDNPRANPESLLALKTRRLSLAQEQGALEAQLEHDRRLLDALRETRRRYRASLESQLGYSRQALAAEYAGARAQADEAQARLQRYQALLADGAVSQAAVNTAQAQLAAARGTMESLDARVKGSGGNVASLRRDVYLDDGQSRLFDLDAQLTALALGLERGQRQFAQQGAELAELDTLVAGEQRRMNMLSGYQLIAAADGTVQDVLAAPGAQVSAGATLVRASDCSRNVVMAVFPERAARRLEPGSELEVEIRGADAPLQARVVQMLNQGSQQQAAGYAAPFPFAEPNAIQVVAAFPANLPLAARRRACSPGRLVDADIRG